MYPLKRGKLTWLCAATLLAACAHQTPQPSAPPVHDMVVIAPQDLSSYWRSSNPAEGLPVLPGSGCVSIELSIDFKGKIHDMKAVALSGPQELSTDMLSYYAGQLFYPVATNSERTPIKTTITVSYSEGRVVSDPKVAEPCRAQLADPTKQKG